MLERVDHWILLHELDSKGISVSDDMDLKIRN